MSDRAVVSEGERELNLDERFALKESIYRLRCEMDTGSPAEAHGWSLNLVRSSDIAAVLNEIDRLMLVNGQITHLWAQAEDRASPPTDVVEAIRDLRGLMDYLQECAPDTLGDKDARFKLESLFREQREEIERLRGLQQ